MTSLYPGVDRQETRAKLLKMMVNVKYWIRVQVGSMHFFVIMQHNRGGGDKPDKPDVRLIPYYAGCETLRLVDRRARIRK